MQVVQHMVRKSMEQQGYVPKGSKGASAEQRSTGNCASGEGLRLGTALILELLLGTEEKLSVGESMLTEGCLGACRGTGTAAAAGTWLAGKTCRLAKGNCEGIWTG